MTAYIVNDARFYDGENGNTYTLANTDSLTVTTNGVIGTTSGGVAAITAGTSVDIWVDGSVTAPYGNAITIGGASYVTVGSRGSVSGSNGIMQSANAGRVRVINNGDISGRAQAVTLSGTGSAVNNTGKINATNGSAIVLFGDGSVVNNSGVIQSSFAAITLYKSTVENPSQTVNNGLITSSTETAIDIVSQCLLTYITNAGTISGAFSATLGVIDGGDGRDVVANSGSIIGNVFLNGGNDSFNSALGTVQGSVDGGAGYDVLVGSRYDDVIRGGSENDTINGGAGDDVLDGGTGVDKVSYKGAGGAVTVDLSIKVAQNTGGSGTDTLTGFENALGSSFGDTLLGTTSANTLSGDAGDDLIDGGAGSDALAGGIGRDTFRFTTTLGSSNVDSISDFVAADDTIALGKSVFAGLASGALANNAFATGATAGEADDRILYNAATGALLFDRDGSGTAYAATQFATVGKNLTLTSADFVVV